MTSSQYMHCDTPYIVYYIFYCIRALGCGSKVSISQTLTHFTIENIQMSDVTPRIRWPLFNLAIGQYMNYWIKAIIAIIELINWYIQWNPSSLGSLGVWCWLVPCTILIKFFFIKCGFNENFLEFWNNIQVRQIKSCVHVKIGRIQTLAHVFIVMWPVRSHYSWVVECPLDVNILIQD